jgi:hypothetical protein
VERFYEGSSSLFVRAYDALHHQPPLPFVGDVGVYQTLASEAVSPVLELTCGTGRIAVALAALDRGRTGDTAPLYRRGAASTVRSSVPGMSRSERYTEFSPTGDMVEQAAREMALRWTYRWELHYLLTLSGFVLEAEYSDFAGSPPAYGKEQIVVARISV